MTRTAIGLALAALSCGGSGAATPDARANPARLWLNTVDGTETNLALTEAAPTELF